MLTVDVTRAESAKFHRPLLLLHGSWTGVWLWTRLAAYLAHRGWESWMLSPAAPRTSLDPAGLEASIVDAVARAAQAPVIVAHGTAAAIASRVAARIGAPALVLFAPVVNDPLAPALGAMFRRAQFWRARLVGEGVPPPRGDLRTAFLGASVPTARAVLVPDSGAVFRALARGTLRVDDAGVRVGLVVSGEHDPISPAGAGAAFAAHHGWEHRVHPGHGHLALVEPGWEAVADGMHRWLIRALGAELLAFLDEEEDAAEE